MKAIWPGVVAGGLFFILLLAAKALRVKDLQRFGETGLSFTRQEHWQAGPFHLHSTPEIPLDSLQCVLLVGVMKYKCLCWYIKIATLIFFSAVDLITIKLPKPSWGLYLFIYLFYCKSAIGSHTYSENELKKQVRLDLATDYSELRRGSLTKAQSTSTKAMKTLGKSRKPVLSLTSSVHWRSGGRIPSVHRKFPNPVLQTACC